MENRTEGLWEQKKLSCPHCKARKIRSQVNVYVDIPAEWRNLSKKGIRDKCVKILGAGWPTATYYCDSCGRRLELQDVL